jgi:HSP20 family protein
VDISEDKGDITVKAEIPGCEAEDIDVQLEGRLLKISGEQTSRLAPLLDEEGHIPRTWKCA